MKRLSPVLVALFTLFLAVPAGAVPDTYDPAELEDYEKNYSDARSKITVYGGDSGKAALTCLNTDMRGRWTPTQTEGNCQDRETLCSAPNNVGERNCETFDAIPVTENTISVVEYPCRGDGCTEKGASVSTTDGQFKVAPGSHGYIDNSEKRIFVANKRTDASLMVPRRRAGFDSFTREWPDIEAHGACPPSSVNICSSPKQPRATPAPPPNRNLCKFEFNQGDVATWIKNSGSTTFIRVGTAGDNYWGGHCATYTRKGHFYVSDPRYLTEFAFLAFGFDDWMEVKINGKGVARGPYGGDRLYVSGGRVRYGANSYGSCELSTSWHQNRYVDLRPHLKAGINTIEMTVIVSGGGEGWFDLRIKRGDGENYCTSGTENGRLCQVPNGTGLQQMIAGGGWTPCYATACESNYRIENGNCVPEIRSCTIENGQGRQIWLGDDWSDCQITSCNSSYHEDNGACVADGRSCYVANGTGRQTWSPYGGWSDCEIQSCDTGFVHDTRDDLCVPSSRTCEIENGFGEKTWINGGWSRCRIKACDAGYEKRGNRCVSTDED